MMCTDNFKSYITTWILLVIGNNPAGHGTILIVKDMERILK